MENDAEASKLRRFLDRTAPERGALVGAVVPKPVAILHTYLEAVRRRSYESAEKAVDEAVVIAGMPIETLLEQIANHADLSALFVQVIGATNRSAYEAKLLALGRVLGQAVVDDAKVDESVILTGVITDLEPPHVRVLQHLSWETPPITIEPRVIDGGGVEGPQASIYHPDEALRRAVPKQMETEVGRPVIAALERHGLVYQGPPAGAYDKDGEGSYYLSAFGRRVLDLVRDAPDQHAAQGE